MILSTNSTSYYYTAMLKKIWILLACAITLLALLIGVVSFNADEGAITE